MPTLSRRRPHLLDWAAAVGLSGPLIVLLYTAELRDPAASWVLLGSIVASTASWIVWRRLPRFQRIAAIAFALSAVGCLISADGPLAFGSAWVACLVLARTFGGAAALAYTAALCATTAGLHIVSGSSDERIVVETVATAVLAGFGTVFALVLRDAERVNRERERLSAEQAATLASLARANDDLRRSLGSEHDLVLAQERERTARELHDGLGHRLTAVGLSLEFAERMHTRDPERAWSEISRARATVREALDSMRKVVRAMHPVELSTIGGTDAFSAIAEAFRSSGLDIRVTVDGERQLSHEQSLLLVRFAQEGLTNVVRHADATRVDLRVTVHENGVDASIEDTGARPATETGVGFGLRSLRARAETLRGSLHATPTPHGFLLRMSLPADEREPVPA
jgi:signal transduction histidine kinase